MTFWVIFLLMIILMRNSYQVNVFWENNTGKCIFWGSKLEYVFFVKKVILKMYFFERTCFERAMLRMYFLKKQSRQSNFENVFYEEAILKMYFLKMYFKEAIKKKLQWWKYLFQPYSGCAGGGGTKRPPPY